MINVPNWIERKQRYEQFWNLTNRTPILYLTSPADNAKEVITPDVTSDDFWFDTKLSAALSREYFKTTYYGGDSYPHVSPSIGPGLLASLLGLTVNYNETSAWVVHKDCPLSEFTDFKLDKENWYFKKMEEFLNTYAEDAKNGDDLDYIVGMVDLNTLMDGVSSLIGPEGLCYEMVDNPDDVKRVTNGHFELYKETFNAYSPIVTRYQGGNTNWLSIYSDIPWYFISVDFMVMLSSEFFDEFIDIPLRKMVDFHPRVMFHLDGENAVYHLDKLLKIENLTGVQVQATPFVQSAEFWIPHLKRIQAANKTAWIEARNKQDVWELINNLKPEGLFIKVWAQTQSEAQEIEKMVNDFYNKTK